MDVLLLRGFVRDVLASTGATATTAAVAGRTPSIDGNDSDGSASDTESGSQSEIEVRCFACIWNIFSSGVDVCIPGLVHISLQS